MLTVTLNAGAYNSNNLMDDSVFRNANAMTLDEIIGFLKQRRSVLASAHPSTLGAGNDQGWGAGEIIYRAARGETSSGSGVNVRINPQVLLATLQKEQSLISLTSENYDAASDPEGRLRKAMGYACPESGGCDPKYAGFYNQVNGGAWQLQWNYDRSLMRNTYSDYLMGDTYTFTNTNVGKANPCDGNNPVNSEERVRLDNQATASLYRYTPHWIMGNCNFVRITESYFEGGGGTYVEPHPEKIATIKQFAGDQDLYVYKAPINETHSAETGYDKWSIPDGNNVVATTGLDYDGDGYKELGVMKRVSGNNYDFFAYEIPKGGEHMPAEVIDRWNVPETNGTIVSIAGADYDGDGQDELAVVKESRGTQTLYLYDVFEGTQMFRTVAMDAWVIPAGNNIVSIAGVDYNNDGYDEIAVMKNSGTSRVPDYDLFVYSTPTAFNADSAGQLLTGDKWTIPDGNNAIDIAGVDHDGDGYDEIAVLKKFGGDFDLFVYDIPTSMGQGAMVGYDKWNITDGNANITIADVD